MQREKHKRKTFLDQVSVLSSQLKDARSRFPAEQNSAPQTRCSLLSVNKSECTLSFFSRFQSSLT